MPIGKSAAEVGKSTFLGVVEHHLQRRYTAQAKFLGSCRKTCGNLGRNQNKAIGVP